jgi:hypothetical protein
MAHDGLDLLAVIDPAMGRSRPSFRRGTFTATFLLATLTKSRQLARASRYRNRPARSTEDHLKFRSRLWRFGNDCDKDAAVVVAT